MNTARLRPAPKLPYTVLALVLLTAVVLGGCGPEPEPSDITATPAAAATVTPAPTPAAVPTPETLFPGVATPVPSPAPIPSPSPTPSPAPTPVEATPTPAPSPVPSPAPTPVPTSLPFVPTAVPTVIVCVSNRDALVAIYNATGGPNWTRNDGWLSDAPLSQWYGVTATDDCTVTMLHLSYNELRGELPPEIGGLPHLAVLGLTSNQLRGGSPSGWVTLLSWNY